MSSPCWLIHCTRPMCHTVTSITKCVIGAEWDTLLEQVIGKEKLKATLQKLSEEDCEQLIENGKFGWCHAGIVNASENVYDIILDR